MKTILLGAILVLMLPFSGITQAELKIQKELLDAIHTRNDQALKVNISFTETTDLDSLKRYFKQNKIHAELRPSIVIRHLQATAQKSQKDVLDYLSKHVQHEDLSPLWIVNRIIAKLDPSQIMSVALFDEVAFIEWERAEFLPVSEIPTRERTEQGIVGNSVEPGLTAINAQEMWKMGYTGRGRLLYDFDTGVWPDHPAFSDRYLGDRFPQSQAWLGYFRDFPNGIISSHGTHTLGTMAGLVQETQDTLGVAFGAYWIANDLVVSSVDALPPIEELAFAFEWALNPDGDINTHEDVPDVINNSWRYSDDPTKEYCDGWVIDLMNAIEAAGIANVFSGGNAGPDNTTVSAPQRINTTVVNTFSVGSVDANQSAPFPISDFSTRGPTQCDGQGSLKIHPQVVAPGQNVRSAWGNNDYNSISGTSMAAPHVSGAVLLLKEAFPYLPGVELLWALYHTAIDYGEPGEDNTFGNGLIDVKAAFDYLSEDNTPVDPTNPEFDLALNLTKETENNYLICDDQVRPVLALENLGTVTPDSITLKYWFEGSEDTTSLNVAGDLAVVDLGWIPLDAFGEQILNFKLEFDETEFIDYDVYNNRCKYVFYRSPEKSSPFFEDFESGLDPLVWLIDNPDLDVTWDTFPTGGLDYSNYSATIQFYNYTPRKGQKDGLILSNLKLPDQENVHLTFDYAYQPFFGSGSIRDTFRIYAMNECKLDEKELLLEAAGEDLYVSDSIFLNFKPAFPGHWKKDSIDLGIYINEKITLLFEGTNMKWNNFYIDNVKVEEFLINSVESSEINPDRILLQPNPANDRISVRFHEQGFNSDLVLKVLDSKGQLKMQSEIKHSTGSLDINISELEDGIYICIVEGKGFSASQRFIKMK